MGYNRFHLRIIGRSVVLTLTIALTVVVLLKTNYIMTVLLLGGTVVYQIGALIRFVERTERDLVRFLQAVRYEDFFETFTGRDSRTHRELHQEFSRIIQDFRQIRSQREEQFLYLQTVIEHIGIALLSFDSEGRVELINSSARSLLKVKGLRNVGSLAEFSSDLVVVLSEIKPGAKKNVKVMDEGELLLLSVHATEFRRQRKTFTLVTLQNIRSELEEKELEAWQNLIRVLTHEIRNSITPIASLASTTGELLQQVEENSETQEEIEDARLAIGTIRKRSDGLLRFVEAFRSLYKVPKPDLKQVSLEDLFVHLRAFFSVTFKEKQIDSSFRCKDEDIKVFADPDLLEQVLINIVTNSIQAVGQIERDRFVRAEARIDRRGRVQITISDNGNGIPEEIIDKIFIPFFTTKSEGTGIGLSLCRQIMRLHKGTIAVESTKGDGATFILTF